MLPLSALEWGAPGALVLLLLPVLALVLGARGGAALARVTGTLEAWRTAARVQPTEERARRRVPPALACLAAALACAVLALARPAIVPGAAARRWTVVVDRSPSMYLVEAGRVRVQAALAPLADWSADELGAADELLWIDAQHPQGRVQRAPPADLLEDPAVPLPEPEWSRFDAEGVLWVRDHADPVPQHAGLSASGGGAVPGPIARSGRARLDWDGERVRRVEQAYDARGLGVACARELPAELRELFGLWARERGFAAGEARVPGLCLAFEAELAGPGRERELAHEGWRTRAQLAPPLVPEVGERTWLATAEGPCVLASPGRIRASIAGLDAPGGDPAAFALSWGALFDACALEPQGIVPLDERAACGAPLWRAPRPAPSAEAARPRALEGVAAALAALLALAAWVLRGLRA